jgi:hypothetical protein
MKKILFLHELKVGLLHVTNFRSIGLRVPFKHEDEKSYYELVGFLISNLTNRFP